MKKILGILAIAVLAVCFAGCAKNTPEAVVESYLKAAKAGDMAKALSYTTLTEEQQKQMVDLYAAASEKDKEAQTIESYKMGEVEMAEDGNSAVVKYTVKFKNNDKDIDGQFDVVKVDGKWKIKMEK